MCGIPIVWKNGTKKLKLMQPVHPRDRNALQTALTQGGTPLLIYCHGNSGSQRDSHDAVKSRWTHRKAKVQLVHSRDWVQVQRLSDTQEIHPSQSCALVLRHNVLQNARSLGCEVVLQVLQLAPDGALWCR